MFVCKSINRKHLLMTKVTARMTDLDFPNSRFKKRLGEGINFRPYKINRNVMIIFM